MSTINHLIGEWGDYWRSKWSVFSYNFGWSNYVFLFDGWVARVAMAVPVVGYLVLFNDSISQHLSFNILAGDNNTTWFGLSSGARLKFVYFGLIFLGTATIIYRLRRPFVFNVGKNRFDYVDRAIKHFTIMAYINIHDRIRSEGEYTLEGDYYDSEYEGFLDLALGKRGAIGRDQSTANWSEAKSKYEGLLRSMLIENFSRNNVKRRFWLSCCIVLSLFGYFLLLVPSVDLFLRVLAVTLGSD